MTPAFGPRLKGFRLGWHWVAKHGCFIRMSDADGDNSWIELCPFNKVPNMKVPNKTGYHRRWWDGEDDILGMLDWLKPVKRIKTYVCVKVDDDGRIVE